MQTTKSDETKNIQNDFKQALIDVLLEEARLITTMRERLNTPTAMLRELGVRIQVIRALGESLIELE